MKKILAAALAALAPDASAVFLSADGTGQALIYPYYTARQRDGNAFNTYLSVVNQSDSAKALRLRFREGRNSRGVLDVNLFLSPNDVWTGAVVPTQVGAQLVTQDVSCTDPGFASEGAARVLHFSNSAFAGGNVDGLGDGLDRTREGFVEVFEMGTLTGAAASAVAHGSAGLPANCAFAVANPQVGPPSGGLSGTLTLINVANGLDATVNAEALADLATSPYFRPPSDPYPAFDAAQITATSVVNDGPRSYRSQWSRGVDGVTAVLMRRTWAAEYVLDAGTLSRTDLVMTMPTRQYYVTATGARAPFVQPLAWSPDCGGENGPVLGEFLALVAFNRATRSVTGNTCSFPLPGPCAAQNICAAAAVTSLSNRAPHVPLDSATSHVLGSVTRGAARGMVALPPGMPNGWIRFSAADPMAVLASLPTSSRVTALGNRVEGPHQYTGLPIVGFSLRTFNNGTLACGAAVCQGNYGGAFPFTYSRSITPAD